MFKRTMRVFPFADILSININNKFETTDTTDIYINLLAAVSKWVFSILIILSIYIRYMPITHHKFKIYKKKKKKIQISSSFIVPHKINVDTFLDMYAIIYIKMFNDTTQCNGHIPI